MTHTCIKCGKVLPVGQKCDCVQRRAYGYAKAEGIHKQYHTTKWQKLRAYVLAHYGYMDVVEFMEHGRAVPAETVHHIIPTDDDPTLFYSTSNLIPVSRATHDAIHTRYRESEQTKRDEQARLKELIHEYDATSDGRHPGAP